MSDKMREEFEKWARTECFDLAAVAGFYSDNETDAAWKAWQAARMVPEGYVVVPVEPTQEMLKKSGLYDDDTIEVNCAASMAGQIYRAMLAAAPKKEGE